MEKKTIHMGVSVEPRALQDEQGQDYYEFVVSDESRDSHGTIFRMSGAKIDQFNADPIVTYGHPSFDSTDPDDVIGIGPVAIEGTRMIARYYPQLDGTNAKAEKVVAKLKAGMIRSASIVAQINERGAHMGRAKEGEDTKTVYFNDYNILAWGVVMKGSNPNAKLRTVERIQEIKEELEVKEITHSPAAEAMLMEVRLALLGMKVIR